MTETVVLDACCTLNLVATGRAVEILASLEMRFVIGPRARNETQWLATPDLGERELVDLQPLIASGLLIEEQMVDEREAALFVEFGALLADGEAEAGALAVGRGYRLATDDKKARRIIVAKYSATALSDTLQLLRGWQVAAGPADYEVAEALRNIAERATFRPGASHPLKQWWSDLTGHL